MTPTFYRARVSALQVSAPDIVGMCDDLLCAARYAPGTNYELQLFRWLMWFFQEQPPKGLTGQHFLPQSVLTQRLSKLPGTGVFRLCQEISQQQGGSLKAHENVNVLTFLKRSYRPQKVRK